MIAELKEKEPYKGGEAMKPSTAYLFAVAGASFWGFTGLFVQNMYRYNIEPDQVVALRMAGSALILFLAVALVRPYLLKVRWYDLPHFIGLGVGSIALFNWCYFTVMNEASLSIAVVLLYTSPVFVALISRFVFKEKITANKLAAILLTIAGCALVAGLLPGGAGGMSLSILMIGLLSGLCCGLYSILGKFVTPKYHSITITAYTMLAGGVVMVPFSGLLANEEAIREPMMWMYGLGGILLSTIAAYILFTIGLKYIESGKAAILSTVEPMVAIVIGVFAFGDRLSSWQGLGIFLIFSAVVLSIYSRPGKFRRKRGSRRRKTQNEWEKKPGGDV
jgi:drug/metabolite transporter (DMT)-like permease